MSFINPENKLNLKIDHSDSHNGWMVEKEIPVDAGEHVSNVIDRLIAFRNAGVPVYAIHNGRRLSSQSYCTIEQLQEVCQAHACEVQEFLAENEIKTDKLTKLNTLEKWEQQYYNETRDMLYSAKTPEDKQRACDTINEFSQVYGKIDLYEK